MFKYLCIKEENYHPHIEVNEVLQQNIEVNVNKKTRKSN